MNASNEKQYPVRVCGQVLMFTSAEMRWFLTGEAYILYWKVFFQKGFIEFGRGALCTADFARQYSYETTHLY